MNFTIVIIGRNSQETLPRLFNGLKEFITAGGEVCFLDTGSKDKTVQIAQLAGCKVSEENFDEIVGLERATRLNELGDLKVNEFDVFFNYAAARNHVASLASNDIVLVFDTDYEITHFDFNALDKFFAEKPADAYYYHYQFAPNVALTIVHAYNHKNCKYHGYAHEVVMGWKDYAHIPHDILQLQHHTVMKNNGERTLALGCDYLDNETTPRKSFYFGRELFYGEQYDAAIKMLEYYISISDWDIEAGQAWVIIGASLDAQKKDPTAAWWKSFETYYGRREPLICLCDYYKRTQQWSKMACVASAAMEIPYNDSYINNMTHYTHVAVQFRYLGRYNSGWDREGAKLDFYKAYTIAPERHEGDRKLFV